MPEKLPENPAVVFLDGTSGHLPTAAGAVKNFLREKSVPIDLCVTLTREFGEVDNLRRIVPPAPRRHWVRADCYQPETVLAHAARYRPRLAVFPPGVFGSEMCGRLSARWRGSAMLGVTDFDFPKEAGGPPSAKKWVYSQNLLAEFSLGEPPWCLGLAKSWAGTPKNAPPDPPPSPDSRDDFFSLPPGKPAHLENRAELAVKDSGELEEARKLLVAGLGLRDAAGVALAGACARLMEARWGVTRPVAMNALADPAKIVGVSGATASPDWALALGASGAAAFLAGVEGAGYLAAVNSDPEAPIMDKCDLAVVGDAREILAEMIALLKSGRE
ncbi:MAG: FAD-binding protein [Deltaproteobacteria bacterium]|nr:FAD-binding protein [Deltaproteobacteria bacterium]